jgi:hypothetical protein
VIGSGDRFIYAGGGRADTGRAPIPGVREALPWRRYRSVASDPNQPKTRVR